MMTHFSDILNPYPRSENVEKKYVLRNKLLPINGVFSVSCNTASYSMLAFWGQSVSIKSILYTTPKKAINERSN